MGHATIIIPLHVPTPLALDCIARAVRVAGETHQVLVVSDRPAELPAGARLVLTEAGRNTGPGEKRDAAMPHVTGDVCAYLDDDAYPRDDWLERALARLEDPTVTAVGGPGLTPPDSSWRERVSGAFYESLLGSGGVRHRFRQAGEVHDIDDHPAYNLVVRSEAVTSVGGWDSRFYGGEDTKFCLALHDAGHRLVYDPDVVVYHHRRPILGPHLRQVGNVGRHRGYFVRRFPKTSARPLYFAPTAAVIAGGALAVWAARGSRSRRALALGLVGAGWTAVAAQSVREGCEPSVAAVLPGVLAATHGAYGVQFVRGLATPHIESM